MRLDGRVALITGAGIGIGRAASLAMAAEGATLVRVDLDDNANRATQAQVEERGGRAAATVADVSRDADAAAMIAFAEDAYGRVDVLCNNAGIQPCRRR